MLRETGNLPRSVATPITAMSSPEVESSEEGHRNAIEHDAELREGDHRNTDTEFRIKRRGASSRHETVAKRCERRDAYRRNAYTINPI
jgi:hypothetical protein